MRNLADDPGSKELLNRMEQLLSTWMKRTGDSWKYDWHELVEDKGRLYTDGTYYSVEEYVQAQRH